MFKTVKKFLEIIFPSHCLTCNKIISTDALFCNDDWQKLQFITEPKCAVCAYPFESSFANNGNLLCAPCLTNRPSFDSLVTIFRYNDQMKKVIADLKYYDATHLSKKFARILLQKIQPEVEKYDLIIAVPLHKKRLRERKFNQAILLARAILKGAKHLEFYPDILLRTKYTKSQVSLNQKERQKNLHGIFEINKKYYDKIKGKNILLIDDVITTGATLENCAKVLKNAQAAKIMVLTVAKTTLN